MGRHFWDRFGKESVAAGSTRRAFARVARPAFLSNRLAVAFMGVSFVLLMGLVALGAISSDFRTAFAQVRENPSLEPHPEDTRYLGVNDVNTFETGVVQADLWENGQIRFFAPPGLVPQEAAAKWTDWYRQVDGLYREMSNIPDFESVYRSRFSQPGYKVTGLADHRFAGLGSKMQAEVRTSFMNSSLADPDNPLTSGHWIMYYELGRGGTGEPWNGRAVWPTNTLLTPHLMAGVAFHHFGGDEGIQLHTPGKLLRSLETWEGLGLEWTGVFVEKDNLRPAQAPAAAHDLQVAMLYNVLIDTDRQTIARIMDQIEQKPFPGSAREAMCDFQRSIVEVTGNQFVDRMIGAWGLPHGCENVPQTCQQFSDAYGTHHNITWGDAQETDRPWWRDNQCTTRPTQGHQFWASCQQMSDTLGTHQNVTWGDARALDRQWWSANGCTTRPTPDLGLLNCFAFEADGVVDVVWDDVDGLDDYAVHRAPAFVAEVGDSTSYRDTPPPGAHRYFVRTRVNGETVDTPCSVAMQVAGSATSSSFGWHRTGIHGTGGFPDAAIDGIVDGNHVEGSVFHSLFEDQPSLDVDLGTVRSIEGIEVWGRTDCCTERFTDVVVFVSDAPFTGRSLADIEADASVTRFDFAGQQPTFVSMNQAGLQGRFVRVQLRGAGILQVAELVVLGSEAVVPEPVVPDRGDMVGQSCTALDNGDGSVSLSWTAIDEEDSYVVRRNDRFVALAGGDLSFTDVPGDGTFTYVVRSRQNGVNTDTTCAPEAIRVEVPGGPVGVQTCAVVDNGDGTADVSWTAIAGENAYSVRRNDKWIALVAGGGLSYSAAGHTAGDDYVIRSRMAGITTDTPCT